VRIGSSGLTPRAFARAEYASSRRQDHLRDIARAFTRVGERPFAGCERARDDVADQAFEVRAGHLEQQVFWAAFV
jgi:hypothetical protein